MGFKGWICVGGCRGVFWRMLMGFGEVAAFRVGFKGWVGLGVSDGCRVVFIGDPDGVWGGGCI